MFKAQVYFKDKPMEYVVVAAFDEYEATQLLKEEFYDECIVDISFKRISDNPCVTIVPYDIYDMFEY